MQIQQSVQNTWRAEGLFHVLPSFALYHSQDMMTDDYGFIFRMAYLELGSRVMDGRINPVAKHAHKFNKSVTYRDRKKDAKAGKTKHRNDYI